MLKIKDNVDLKGLENFGFTFCSDKEWYCYDIGLDVEKSDDKIPDRYIINDGATILFWKDGTKTIVKRSDNDEFDPIKSFLWAYFQKHCGLSKTKANKYLWKIQNDIELKLIRENNIFNVGDKVVVKELLDGIGVITRKDISTNRYFVTFDKDNKYRYIDAWYRASDLAKL